MKIIHWGIIGPGKIADKFASDLLSVPNTKLYAIASSSSERAKFFAEKYHVEHHFDSYEEMLHLPNLDVVYVATPHTFHAEHAILCLEKGIPVLCEKPFAMNLRQVQKMIDAAQRHDVFLMEAMWTRFIPAIQKTLDLIRDGAIGEIKTIHADFGFPANFDPNSRLFNPDLGGGALLDIGIYPIYLSLLLLGYPIKIKALAAFTPTNVDATTSILLQYKNQATALLNCSISAQTRTEAFIYGDKGYIQIVGRFMEATQMILKKNDEEEQVLIFPRKTFGYNFEAQEVVECLLQNKKESDLMPLSMSVKLISLLDDIRQEIGLIYPRVD